VLKRREGPSIRHTGRQWSSLVLVLAMLAAVTAGCTTMTGKSAGTNVDDAKITASVKTKLAEEKVSTLTKVDVDTNRGIVYYLTGNVENPAMKTRATEIARQVAGVRDVVNNLQIQ
jgi:hyperosmotically inducible protein